MPALTIFHALNSGSGTGSVQKGHYAEGHFEVVFVKCTALVFAVLNLLAVQSRPIVHVCVCSTQRSSSSGPHPTVTWVSGPSLLSTRQQHVVRVDVVHVCTQLDLLMSRRWVQRYTGAAFRHYIHGKHS